MSVGTDGANPIDIVSSFATKSRAEMLLCACGYWAATLMKSPVYFIWKQRLVLYNTDYTPHIICPLLVLCRGPSAYTLLVREI